MTATGTSRRVAATAAPLLATLVAALGLAGGAPASIDLAAKVRVDLVARPAVGGGVAEPFQVRDGGVLRTGDGVQLRIATDADAYVYVVAFGSSNTPILLHPFSGRSEDALVRQGQTKAVPEPGFFLPLDDREGRETLFTIVSGTPLADISDVLATLARTAADADGAAEIMRGAYPQVKRLSFKHIGAQPLVGVAGAPPRTATAPVAPGAAVAGTPKTPASGDAAGPRPSATGGWSVPSSDSFGTTGVVGTPEDGVRGGSSEATAAAAAAAVSAGAARDGGPGTETSRAEDAQATDTVSPALRKARQAAGIDEQVFRGILATLPGSDQVEVPASFRRPTKEQGVLSAEGSRLRAIHGGRLESGGAPETKIQN